jgi:hypothetical protein
MLLTNGQQFWCSPVSGKQQEGCAFGILARITFDALEEIAAREAEGRTAEALSAMSACL